MFATPAKQTATETINTLCNRLNSATLLEDRRDAIRGLRSFAKDYPASVASGALRALISSLTQDAEDVDTIKIVLETLLALFEPNEKSLEDSEDIALWLADEFSQRQDNITILLDFLEKPDYHPRFYALRILQAIFAARDERTQECIISAPLGTTRLVATLDDPREAIRDVGLRLLVGLTGSFPELQKLVAFENAFDRLFAIIEAEGSLIQGGAVVQDCLMLLHNLIRGNNANQSLFRESGGAAQLEKLLPGEPKKSKAAGPADPADDWTHPDSEKNIWGLLSIIRLFLTKGSVSTQPNQNTFAREIVVARGESNYALLEQVLNLAFNSTSTAIRAESLNVVADIIRGNPRIQIAFGGFHRFRTQDGFSLFKEAHKSPLTNGNTKDIVVEHVMEALLELALNEPSNAVFDVRFAACECIQAYLYDNREVKMHFLDRAIAGHTSGTIESSNVLTTLLHGPSASSAKDPYRIWFAAAVVFHLVFDDPEAKGTLMSVVEGDASSGEEVVTCIQTLSSNLVASLRGPEDEKISVAYLSLLAGWLFESPSSVDDFLSEGSTIPVLVSTATRTVSENTVRRGLCAFLLGILYEFSTKDSPIPRRELQPVLTTKLGREKYIMAISDLRQHALVRDFEVLSQAELKDADGVPQVYFDETFMAFLKDNFSRISRAVDRDPTLEVQITAGAVDRNLLDELRGELEKKNSALQKAEAELLGLETKLNQEQAEHRRTLEGAQAEAARIKTVNDALQKNHHLELQKVDANNRKVIENLEKSQAQSVQQLQAQVQQAQRETVNAVEKARRPLQDEITKMKQTVDVTTQKANKASTDKDKLSKDFAAEREWLTKESTAEREKLTKSASAERERLLAQIRELETSSKRAATELKELQTALSASERTLSTNDRELQDLQTAKTELEKTLEKIKHENEQLRAKSQDQIWAVKDAEDKLRKAEKKTQDVEDRIKKAEEKSKKAEQGAKEKDEERKKVQSELDDMLMLLGDIEEKRTRDKKRLKELGEEISDAESDEDGDDDDEDEDEDASGVD